MSLSCVDRWPGTVGLFTVRAIIISQASKTLRMKWCDEKRNSGTHE